MLVSQDHISSIIPQKEPFVMIDELMSCDEINSKTKFLVKADNILIDNDELSEAGLTENIAQPAAAGFGYLSQKNNKPVLVGFIAAIKNLEVFALPKIGEIIETTVAITNQVFDVTIISGRVKRNGELLASCEMKIFIKE